MHHLKDDIGYWINRLRTLVHQAFEERLLKHDITCSQWCILLVVYNRKADSITGLSKYIEVDKASISRVIDRLVEKQLLVHLAGSDRRSGRIQITAKGKKLIPKLIKEAEDNEQYFFGCLTNREVEQLQGIFQKIFKNVSSVQLEGWLGEIQKES